MVGEQVAEALLVGAQVREQAAPRTANHGIYWAVAGAFGLLSAAMTWPMVAHLGSRVLGPPAPGDSFYYLFLLRWVRDGVFGKTALSQLLWNPWMFYPFGYNLALSETTLSTTLLALPLTALLGEVVAYNLVLFVSFVLSGLGAYLLVLRYTQSRAAAFLGGVVFAFSPYRMSHLGAGHLPLMGTQWLPFLLLYLDKTVSELRVSNAVLAATFYVLGALSSWYYAYMFALAGFTFVVLRGRPWRRHLLQRRFIQRAAVFVLLVALCLGPLAAWTARGWSEGERPHSLRYIDQFSASPADFVYPSVLQPLWGTWLARRYTQNINENILYLGLLPFALAAVSLMRGRRRAAHVYGGLCLVFFVIALGTTLHWRNAPVYVTVPAWLERAFTVGMGLLTGRLALYPISSYSLRLAGSVFIPMPALLMNLYLPFFSAMRVWARFGLVAALGVSVLAGLGHENLAGRSDRKSNRLLSILLVGAVLFEYAAIPYALGSCSVEARPVDDWLASQSGDWAIMELPVAKATSGRPLYMAVTHEKRICFGYGTFFPQAFNEQRAVLESFPSSASIALLAAWGVRYVLVGAGSFGAAWPQLQQNLAHSSAVRHVATFDDRPIYAGDRLLGLLPGTEQAFVVDRIYVYEVL